MAKIDISRTELVWPGKYNEDGTLKEVPRVSLPFQVIETVNESRATREAKKGPKQTTLFDVYEGKEGDTFEDGWRNKLIWGDNLLVMGSLLEKFAGKIELIYIDPPFATGTDFSFTAPIGDGEDEIFKEQSALEEKAYRDTWGQGTSSYLTMMRDRVRIMHKLLSATGSLMVHCDWRLSGALRLLIDEVFGADRFINELIWRYGKMSNATNRFPRNHDTIFFYSKSEDYKFLPVKGEDSEYRARFIRYLTDNKVLYGSVRNSTDKLILGRVKKVSSGLGRPLVDNDVLFDFASEFKTQDDVFYDISIIKGNAEERLDYPTQKPEGLLHRLIMAVTTPGDLVADFFCGSGTTLAVAEKLGRRWIGCDLGRWGTHVTRKRLLGIENCKPFEVLNLGKYERQYWQGVTFGEAKDKPLVEQALYEYLAFILKLYGAQPVSGLTQLHGKKGKAMIHIGAVDAPVTIGEIDAAVDECAKLKQTELHVLGWEWEMGLYDLMVGSAKQKGVKLLLLQIPREVMEQQAAAKGDVRFFELAYLEAEIKQPKKLTAAITLKDFVIANTELIPEDVRSKVKKWSDYIDYWAVDWDFRNDTFMQGWVAYRTRKERKLPLTSDAHTYEKAGKYRILVKVIDIFGNDTSQAFDVEVK